MFWGFLFCFVFSQEIIVTVDNETGAEKQPNCAVMGAMATRAGMLSSRVFKSKKL